jgi:hypothetical protein
MLTAAIFFLAWRAFSGNFHDPFHRGFVLSLFGEDPAYTYEDALHDMAGLGAETVSLMVVSCQDHERSAAIFSHPELTPSDDRLREVIEAARGLGFRVLLMPTLYLLEPGEGAWRGTLNPDDIGRWMASYRALILKYARLAQAGHVNYFCIGSELCAMERRTDFWRGLIRRVRAVFSGRLLYSANWDHLSDAGFMDDLDFLGMNGYFNVNPGRSPAPDQAGLARAWRRHIRKVSAWRQKAGKPLVITEAGYRSVKGCLREPWNYGRAGAAAHGAQAMGYRAFIRAWQGVDFLQGVYFYNWAGPGGPADTDYTPKGKPAERVVRRWFEGHGL